MRDLSEGAGSAVPPDSTALRRMRGALRSWRAPLMLLALLVLLQGAGLRGELEYRRAEVLRGQVWRLLTGNLVHLGWTHLLRDGAGLLLIWALVAQPLGRRASLWVLGVSGLTVGLGLLALSPDIGWYVGISGALFGLFSAGALSQLGARPVYASALLCGMAAIIAWTLHAGALPDETLGLGGSVVPQAHLYGALGGAAFVSARAALCAYRPPRVGEMGEWISALIRRRQP